MRRSFWPVLSAVFLALGGCVTNAPGVPESPASSASSAVRAASIQNDAGEFGGKVNDSVYGSGFGTGSLAQVQHEVGGYVTITYYNSAQTTVTNAFTASTQSGLALSGAEVGRIDSDTCSFKMSATYNPTSHVLAGTYEAVHGCSGESGSFSLTKGCYYPRTGLDDDLSLPVAPAQAHPNSGLHPC